MKTIQFEHELIGLKQRCVFQAENNNRQCVRIDYMDKTKHLRHPKIIGLIIRYKFLYFIVKSSHYEISQSNINMSACKSGDNKHLILLKLICLWKTFNLSGTAVGTSYRDNLIVLFVPYAFS